MFTCIITSVFFKRILIRLFFSFSSSRKKYNSLVIVFRKGLNMYEEESEELAFDLHYWLKNAPFKHEDFLKLEQAMDIEIQ